MIIAIPDGGIADPILTNVRKVCERLGWTIKTSTADGCGQLLLANMAGMALTTPLGYGQGVGKVDYRIVPGPCVAIQDYTNTHGIWFPHRDAELGTYTSDNLDGFTSLIGKSILAEKFEVVLEPSKDRELADCIIDEVKPFSSADMDLSEEWFDLIESPLPIGLWVCRVDSEIEGISEAIKEFADASVTDRQVSEMLSPDADRLPREGKILYRWTDEIEEGLTATLHTLFYHQHFSELPGIKILGRD